jgi:hypothetical protein
MAQNREFSFQLWSLVSNDNFVENTINCVTVNGLLHSGRDRYQRDHLSVRFCLRCFVTSNQQNRKNY